MGSGTTPGSPGSEVAAAAGGVGGGRSRASSLLSPPPPHSGAGYRRGHTPVFPRAPAVKMPEPVLALGSGQVLPAFLLCSTLLVIKMYVVAVITGQVRLRKKVRAVLGDPSPPRWFRGQSDCAPPSPLGWLLCGPRVSRTPAFLSSALRAFPHSLCRQVSSWPVVSSRDSGPGEGRGSPKPV